MATPLGRSNTPSLLGLHTTNRPQTFCILFPTPKGIVRRAYPVHPSTTAFLTTIPASDIEKNRPAISDPSPCPFSSCDDANNILSCSHGLESIEDENTLLEWSKLDQKKVSYHVFYLLHVAKYSVTSPIHCKSMYAPNLMHPNSTSLLSTPKVIARRASSAHPSTLAFPTATDIAATKKPASPPATLPHAFPPAVVVSPTSYHVPSYRIDSRWDRGVGTMVWIVGRSR